MEESHSKVTVPEIHLKAPCINIFWRILPQSQAHWNMGYRALTAVESVRHRSIDVQMKDTIPSPLCYIYRRLYERIPG